MSISTLISSFGVELHIYRPTLGVSADGKTQRTYALVGTVVGFLQPSSQTSDFLEGRSSGRTAGSLFIAGTVDVRIDDEIYSAKTGAVDRWRVNGATNPGEVARVSATHRLNLTVVDVVQIDPQITL